MFKRFFALFISLSLCVGAVWAGDFEDGVVAYNNRNYVTAIRKLKLLAEQGNAVAQFYLGNIYHDAMGDFYDPPEAVRWFKLSAVQGNPNAQFNLAVIYNDGSGVVKDLPEAVRWYKLAAIQGDADAQLYLGISYRDGRGIAKNPTEAMRWFKSAAEQGNSGAMFSLSYMYDDGEGINQDYVRAHMWSNMAEFTAPDSDSWCGNWCKENARKFRYGLTKAMTPQQIVEAERLARECKRRNFKNCD